MTDLNELAQEVYKNAVAHGWWDEPRNFGEALALIHSEVSEALEHHRKGEAINQTFWLIDSYTGERIKPDGIPIEFADIIIRVLDLCGGHNIDIDAAIKEKMAYNVDRPLKHNKQY